MNITYEGLYKRDNKPEVPLNNAESAILDEDNGIFPGVVVFSSLLSLNDDVLGEEEVCDDLILVGFDGGGFVGESAPLSLALSVLFS